jgi:hypothetical protein
MTNVSRTKALETYNTLGTCAHATYRATRLSQVESIIFLRFYASAREDRYVGEP